MSGTLYPKFRFLGNFINTVTRPPKQDTYEFWLHISYKLSMGVPGGWDMQELLVFNSTDQRFYGRDRNSYGECNLLYPTSYTADDVTVGEKAILILLEFPIN